MILLVLCKRIRRPNDQQSGTALLASLLLLLVITIISVTAMKDTMMDESMARNDQNHTVAFQAADAAVNRTLTLLRNDEVLAEQAKTAKESGTADPTRSWAPVWDLAARTDA